MSYYNSSLRGYHHGYGYGYGGYTQVTAAAAAAMAADTGCIRMAAMAATRDTRMAVSGTKNNGDAVRGLVPLSTT
jgi:hypothetical protein